MELQLLVKIIARNDRDLLDKLYAFVRDTDGDTIEEEDVLDLLAGCVLSELDDFELLS